MEAYLKRLVVWTLAVILSTVVLSAQQQDTSLFRTEVSTDKKPWTNLRFYNDPANFQFAIVSDRSGGIRPGIFEDAVTKLNKLYPEFVLSVGDLIQGYTEDTLLIKFQWNEIDSILRLLKVPFFRLPGNHDISNASMKTEWDQRYGKRYYSFTYKNVLFIIMDSNDGGFYNISDDQADFVLKTLEDNSNVRWTFVLMHHPVWWYSKEDSPFHRVEEALDKRNYTVFAGHNHRYLFEERNRKNYYILATTGGVSDLRGNSFGEFDHISWVTMVDEGPSIVNLRLDGILPDDVVNVETAPLTKAIANNSKINNIMLCNEGEMFTDATLYIKATNTSNDTLYFTAMFFHNHQVEISKPVINVSILPGSDQFIEIQLEANDPLPYNELDKLQLEWKWYYDLKKHPDLKLNGSKSFKIEPSKTTYLRPKASEFTNKAEIILDTDYNNLVPRYTLDGSVPNVNSDVFDNSLILRNTKTVSVKFYNKREQSSSTEVKIFKKVRRIQKDGM